MHRYKAERRALHVARSREAGALLGPRPKNAEQRRRRASKGGRGKANTEVRDLKSLIADLTDRVLSGELEKGKAAIANQLINTQLRAIELERKVREQEDILARIEALERRQDFSSARVPRRGGKW